MLFLISHGLNAQEMEIKLYSGHAPGSERWTWQEEMNNNNSMNVMTVFNVVHPSLTVHLPDPSAANGTAIVICPGGGFHFLAIDHEGNNIAKELVKKGITVFVLKYRLVHVLTNNPFDEMINTADMKAWDDQAMPIIPLAIDDGRKALAYVRLNASQFNLNPEHIGIMGFSAGGMVAATTAFGYDSLNRPSFVAPIYGDLPESRLGTVLADAPPLFVACSQDDEFGFASHAINIYNKWYQAKRPVEMHLFTRGGHGFGAGNVGTTTYRWIDQFTAWLKMMKLIP